MQFYLHSSGSNHFSWNGGGGLQPSGTNELMRLTRLGELSISGSIYVGGGSIANIGTITNPDGDPIFDWAGGDNVVYAGYVEATQVDAGSINGNSLSIASARNVATVTIRTVTFNAPYAMFNADSNGWGHFGLGNDSASMYINMDGYWGTSLNNNNYYGGGGVSIGATNLFGNGGYGLRVYNAVNGSARFEGATTYASTIALTGENANPVISLSGTYTQDVRVSWYKPGVCGFSAAVGPSQGDLVFSPYTGVAAFTIAYDGAIAINQTVVPFYAGGAALQITGLVKLTGSQTFVPQAAPSSPTEGQVYYDSTAHALKVYNGSAWKTVTVS
jgi:hypothetical protein